MNPTPIFLFSLPRSGSTLLQRILGFHPDVATLSEPWILLPMVYSMKKEGLFSEYNQKIYATAIQDVIESLPNGKADYHGAIRAYTNLIYSRLCSNNESWFLDKTPRYYLIIKEIAEIFPDAKFIFLFRHPLSVYASIIETFNKGRLGTYWNRIDLYKGPVELARGYGIFKNRSIALKFEDLITSPEDNIKMVCDYLGLPYLPEMIDEFNSFALKGKLGDSTGKTDYQTLATEPVNKWKNIFCTGYRKKYAKKYIQQFDEIVFKTMGFSKSAICKDIENIKRERGGSFNDRLSLLSSKMHSIFEIPILKQQMKHFLVNRKIREIHF